MDNHNPLNSENTEMLDEDNLIELTDEEGVTSQFEYLTTIPYEGEEYVVLMAVEEEGTENEDEGEVVILRIEKDDNGEDIYVSCDDEETVDHVFDLFLESVDEEEGEE